MAAVVNYYNLAMNEASDMRTKDWLLMSSPWPAFGLTALYLYIVWTGPSWMEKRQAFSLKHILVIYNFALVLLSAYMTWEFFASSVLEPGFSLVCQRVDTSNSPAALRVFFILRKKTSQISFLHVYHHSTMVILWWLGVRFVPGGESYFSAMINCLIHVLMYGYYMMSSMGPHMQKYLWWKKYMTSLQLLQFFLIVCHTSVAYFKECGYPNGYNIALITYGFSHILLFSNFYQKTYIRKDQDKAVSNGKARNGNMYPVYQNGYCKQNGLHISFNGIHSKKQD